MSVCLCPYVEVSVCCCASSRTQCVCMQFALFWCIANICVHALIKYWTYGSMFENMFTPFCFQRGYKCVCVCVCVCFCVCVCVCVCACVCAELSRDQHTCRWVFITAGLSDGLAYRRLLFIVISLHLISPHSQARDHWRPPCVFACAYTGIFLGFSFVLYMWPGGYTSVHMYTHILRHTRCIYTFRTLSPNHLRIILRRIRLAQAGPCFTDMLKLHLTSCSETALWNQIAFCFHLYLGLSLEEISSWLITGNAISRRHCCEMTLSSAAKNVYAVGKTFPSL